MCKFPVANAARSLKRQQQSTNWGRISEQKPVSEMYLLQSIFNGFN